MERASAKTRMRDREYTGQATGSLWMTGAMLAFVTQSRKQLVRDRESGSLRQRSALIDLTNSASYSLAPTLHAIGPLDFLFCGLSSQLLVRVVG